MYQVGNIFFFLIYIIFNPKLILLAIRGIHIPAYLQYVWLKGFKVETFIDVGAYTGQVSKAIRHMFPHATIYAFEPVVDNYNAIKKCIAPNNFFLENTAISNNVGKSKFFINNSSPASSLLHINPKYRNIYPSLSHEDKIEVKTTTLDSYFKSKKLKHLIFLKIDVQGAEQLILQGAVETLGSVDIIHIETAFDELYEKQASFTQIYEFLIRKGFKYKGNIRETDFYPIFKLPRQQNSIFIKKGIKN